MELDLVQKVELRLLLAKSDEKFTASVALFLIPLLQKLSSTNSEVVAKVVDVLAFIKKRRSESGDISLPLSKLIELHQNSINDIQLLTQNRYTLHFISLELSLTNSIVPLETFVHGLRLKNHSHEFSTDIAADSINMIAEQFSLFLLTLRRIAENSVTDSSNKQTVDVKIDCKLSNWNADDLAVIQDMLPKFMLLDLKHRGLNNQYGALTKEDVLFYTKHGEKLGLEFPQRNDSSMNQCRRAIVQLAQTFPLIFSNTLVAGMGDPVLQISKKCRLEVNKMKKIDTEFLARLSRTGNPLLMTNSLEVLRRHRYYNKVDADLIQSTLDQDDLRLRQASLLLLLDAVSSLNENEEWHSQNAIPITKRLRQYIFDDGWPRAQIHSSVQTHLRQLCYEIVGMLSSEPQIVSFLLQSLDRDSPDIAPSIQKGLSSIISRGNINVDSKKLLDIMLFSGNSRTRYSAVTFASKLPSNISVNRAVLLLGIDKQKNTPDIVMETKNSLISDTLPNFLDMFNTLNELINWQTYSIETIEVCVMYLLLCLMKTPPSSIDWADEVKASLEMTSNDLYSKILTSGEEQILVYTLFLFDLMMSTSKFCDVIPLITSRIILNFDGETLASFKGRLNIDKLREILQKGTSEYCSFIAEYIPLISPEVEFNEVSRFTKLCDAYKLALYGRETTGIDVDSLLDKDVDIGAYCVLSACGYLKSAEGVPKSLETQFIKACVGMNSDVDYRKSIIEELFKLRPKSFDEIVSNGEAISIAISGWNSKTLQNRYPYLYKKYLSLKNSDRSTELDQLSLRSIVDGIRGSPESRRLSSVRLLCLTEYSFYDADKYSHFANGIQSCFMSLLSDADDVTQEAAGRGLSILFQNGKSNKSVQKNLLSALLSSFIDDEVAKKNTSGKLTLDTQVFEPGALPSGPHESGSITTYKDILNLANETGDSSLVYKFMSLSSNSQIWTGRKGIAFSLQQIISKSEVSQGIIEGSDVGKKLIPKLFRYLYDPIEVTKQAMKQIWVTLIPGPQRSRVIKFYFKLILKELTDGIVDRQWRVRQASCSALSDMISNGTLEGDVQILRIAFRAVDDIKESVSAAGRELIASLCNSLVRMANKGTVNASSNMNEIIPFLIKGLNQEASAKFSLEILLKLSDTDMFKPYAPTVLTELVLQLSSLEPQSLNYLAQHMGQKEIDSARLAALQTSPIIQGIESMVDRGSPTNEQMWEILSVLVKKSVGVPSKLAAARLVTLTCLHTYGGDRHGSRKLLESISSEIFGSNEACSESYASALGYVCRHLSFNLVTDYLKDLRSKYIHSEPDDSRTRWAIAISLKAISTNANDVFISIANEGLSLAYVAMSATEEEKKTKKLFERVWDDNTGGASSIKLYASDILRFAGEILEYTNSRLLKVSTAIAIQSVMSVLKNDTNKSGSIGEAVEFCSKMLKSNLFGSKWPKKENLQTAYDMTIEFLNDSSAAQDH